MLRDKRFLKFNLLFLTFSLGAAFIAIYYRTGFNLLNLQADSRIPPVMIWNIFLALLAYDFAYGLVKVKNFWLQLIFAFLAFLFYPNTFYMLTDSLHFGDWLQAGHLTFYGTKPMIYFMLLCVAIFFGVALGLETMRIVLKRFFDNKFFAWAFIIIMSFLGSIGIFVGRFQEIRLNSWDIFINPIGTVVKLFAVIQPTNFVFLASFTLAQIFLIILFWEGNHAVKREP